MDNIIPKALIPVVAILMIGLILSQPVIHSFLSLAVTGAMLIGAIGGAIVGYYVVHTHEAEKLVHEQYKSDVDKYTRNLMNVYENSWYNIMLQLKDVHDQFYNRTFNYYQRWAESIASSICNENKSSISDEDLEPIIDDYVQVIRNYVARMLDSVYDLYRKGKMLAEMRANAGLDGSIQFLSWCSVNNEGKINCGSWDKGVLKNFTLKVNDVAIGYVTSSGEKYVNETAIKEVFLGSSTFKVDLVLHGENGEHVWSSDTDTKLYYMHYNEFGNANEYSDFDVLGFIKSIFVDTKMMYVNVKASADNYCYMIATTGGQPLPPPDVSLPYDFDTLNKLDPLARMQLYMIYLYYMSTVDWEKVGNLTLEDIKGLPDKSVKINGSIDVDGDGQFEYNGSFIPMYIPFTLYFSNGTWGIAGIWYWYDPSANTMKIIKLPLYDPTQYNYTVEKDLGHEEYLVRLNDNKTLIGIDTDGDKRIDYLAPTIYITGIEDLQYDYKSGEYKKIIVNEIIIGPQPVKEWTDKRLKDAGALSEIDIWKIKILDWWNGLDWKTKIAIIAGGAVLLLIILRAFSGTRITVVR